MHHPIGLLGNQGLLTLVQDLQARGEPFAVATVVSRRPPVSARVGDKAVIRASGTLHGWIGGSCSQPIVRREALAAMAAGAPRLVKLTTEELGLVPVLEGITQVAMTCPSGGEMEVYIEPHLKRPQVITIGDSPLTGALVQMAQILGFDAQKVDEAEGLSAVSPRRDAFIVVATAGHFDEEAIAAALRTPARYIALVASRKRSAAVMEYLQGAGLTPDALARVRTPAGLEIGAATQEEIALSVLAEIVRELRQESPAAADEILPIAAPQLARDPVCGMEVEVVGARHTAEYEGQVYYFCCPHCLAKFLKDPAACLESVHG